MKTTLQLFAVFCIAAITKIISNLKVKKKTTAQCTVDLVPDLNISTTEIFLGQSGKFKYEFSIRYS